MNNLPGIEREAQQTRGSGSCGEDTLMELIFNLYGDESGAAAVEYAFLVAFITVAIVASVKAFGEAVSNLFNVQWP